jgi:hypothetical protein
MPKARRPAGDASSARATLDLIPHLTARQQSDLIAFLRTLDDALLSRALTQAPSAS